MVVRGKKRFRGLSHGDVHKAIPLHEATLTQYEQVLGDTHPDTLTSRNDLAHAI
ncbi:tetratricopeptide repeat protein [Streptomyces sp. SD15]